MFPIKVDISPKILDWLSEAASFETLNDELRSLFYAWKAGSAKPTYSQIEKLSKKTRVPLGYFFLDNPPQETLPLPEYRTINSVGKSQPSRDLIDTCYQMEEIQDWMRDYRKEAGNGPLSFVGLCKDEKDAVKLAAAIRNNLGIAVDWYTRLSAKNDASFSLLRSICDSAGILVLKNGVVGQNNFRKLDVHEFRAFTLIDEYAPLIFINTADSQNGRLFSLVHEIAHVFLGLHSFYNSPDCLVPSQSSLETLCNAAASEILAPNQFFLQAWRNDMTLDVERKITGLAKMFRCGEIVIARKAFDNNFVSGALYQEFTAKIINLFNNSSRSSGGNYYNTGVSRYGASLILALDESVKQGRTQYTEAYRLTNTTRATFPNLVIEARGK